MADDSNRCPVCGATARDTWAEVAHMESQHPDVVYQRMIAAGEREAAQDFARRVRYEVPDGA